MKICRKCRGINIKSHKTYTHGKKSKPIVTMSCKNCNSTDIEIKSNNKRYKK